VASEVVCDSRIEGVTVYARGAVVRRRVALPETLPDAPCEVVTFGVTASADPGSLRATFTGGRDVLGVRARLVVPEKPAIDGSLTAKVDALRRAHEDLTTARSHAVWRRDVLASVHPEPDLVRRVQPPNPADRIADALAVVKLASDEMASLDARVAELDAAIEANERAAEAAQIAAAQANASDAALSAPPRYAVTVELGPAKEGASAASLELEYAVSAARWWPTYRARFTDGATRVALTLSALVAQASGEDWTAVALSLSTGDLLRDARLPELSSLRLGRAQKPRSKGYRAPPEGLDAMFEGYDRFVAEVHVTTTITTAWQVRQATGEGTRAPGGRGSDGSRAPATGAPPPWSDPSDLPAPYAEYGQEDEYDSPTTVTPPQEMLRGKRLAMLRAEAPKPAAPMPSSISMPLGSTRSKAEYASDAAAAAPAPMQAPGRAGGMGAPKGGGLAGLITRSITYDQGALEEGTMSGLAPEGPIEPADAWLDFDTLRLDLLAPRDRRGRLLREDAPHASGVAEAAHKIQAMEAPAGTIDPRASRGLFDVAYTATGTSDVPSSGRPHRVTIAAAEAPASARFVTVPREAPEVYRRADVTNPFGVPLLTGPVEVLIDGALVALTRLSYTDRGGQISIGLGVEDRVKVARNSRIEEGSAGLLGGSTTVEHTVTTDLSSSLGRAIKVDVLDRLPVSDDKDVDVKLLVSQPSPVAYTQADLGQPVRKAFKWELDVPAGGKARAEWRYRVTLPSKMEIVGGNRRE